MWEKGEVEAREPSHSLGEAEWIWALFLEITRRGQRVDTGSARWAEQG